MPPPRGPVAHGAQTKKGRGRAHSGCFILLSFIRAVWHRPSPLSALTTLQLCGTHLIFPGSQAQPPHTPVVQRGLPNTRLSGQRPGHHWSPCASHSWSPTVASNTGPGSRGVCVPGLPGLRGGPPGLQSRAWGLGGVGAPHRTPSCLLLLPGQAAGPLTGAAASESGFVSQRFQHAEFPGSGPAGATLACGVLSERGLWGNV